MEMAQRLTITIPDELNERLQTIKEKLNISGVCQKALDLAIQIEETKDRTDISAMEKAIARLRKQKHETGARWKKIGYSDGLKEATEELDYKMLKYIGEGGDIDKGIVGLWSGVPITAWLEHFCEGEYRYLDDFEFDIYVDGWVEGVSYIWKEIKDKL